MTDTDDAFKLAAIRGILGLSQSAFAEMLGVTQPTISRWESGRAKPGIAVTRYARTLIGEMIKNHV